MPTPPPDTDTVRARLAALLPELREHYGVRSLALFGSYARGEQTAESDLDLLVTFDRTPGLLAFVNLQHRLEDRLGLRVDLATRPMIGPRLQPQVQADLDAEVMGDA
jgi:predicted nucleotidyltransferase